MKCKKKHLLDHLSRDHRTSSHSSYSVNSPDVAFIWIKYLWNLFLVAHEMNNIYQLCICGLSKIKKPIVVWDEKSAAFVSEKIYITRILRTSFTSSDSNWRKLDPKSIQGYSCHLQQRQMQTVVYRAGQYGQNYYHDMFFLYWSMSIIITM